MRRGIADRHGPPTALRPSGSVLLACAVACAQAPPAGRSRPEPHAQRRAGRRVGPERAPGRLPRRSPQPRPSRPSPGPRAWEQSSGAPEIFLGRARPSRSCSGARRSQPSRSAAGRRALPQLHLGAVAGRPPPPRAQDRAPPRGAGAALVRGLSLLRVSRRWPRASSTWWSCTTCFVSPRSRCSAGRRCGPRRESSSGTSMSTAPSAGQRARLCSIASGSAEAIPEPCTSICVGWRPCWHGAGAGPAHHRRAGAGRRAPRRPLGADAASGERRRAPRARAPQAEPAEHQAEIAHARGLALRRQRAVDRVRSAPS